MDQQLSGWYVAKYSLRTELDSWTRYYFKLQSCGRQVDYDYVRTTDSFTKNRVQGINDEMIKINIFTKKINT